MSSHFLMTGGENVAENWLYTSLCITLILKASCSRLGNNTPVQRAGEYVIDIQEERRHTKPNNFAKIPTVPMIVQSVVSRGRPHFTNTRRQWICACPCRFDVFTSRPPSAFHVAQVEALSALRPVAVNVPTWNGYANLGRVRDLHRLWEFGHALSEVFRPLADNVVSYDDSHKCYAHKGGEGDEINVAISR